MSTTPEPPSLDDAWSKLNWARKHFEVLRPQIEAFEQRDSHTITVEADADAGQYVFYIHGLDSIDPDWGLQIGDVLHNARTALDYLMVRLVAIVRGVSPRDVGDVQFPVYEKPLQFDGRLGELAKEHQLSGYLARVKELQPFNRGNLSIWGPRAYPPPLPGALLRLAQLDNLDKHRVIHAAWLSARWPHSAFPDIKPPAFEWITGSMNFGELENGAEIATWYFAVPLPFEWEPTEMEMKKQFPINVALDEPLPFNRVLEVLPFCLWGVNEVLKLFDPVFRHRAPPLPVTSVPEPSDPVPPY